MPSLIAAQCRMARAALQLGVRDVAAMANVSPNTIARLERGENLQERTLQDIRRAFENAGVIFLADGEAVGGGPGVRLCKTS
ncbi:helix-turn-helix domain-containing protein [Azospirillum argentinense]|uniref:helix-turn-helix domain-containing protein n=1 Tax=Azospirillum argentinense TaxID=2970906 RepID=UPI003D81ACF5